MGISDASPASLIAEVEAVVDVATVSMSIDPTFDVRRSDVVVFARRIVVDVQERDRIFSADADEIRSTSWTLKSRERRHVVFVVRVAVEVETIVVLSIFIVLEKNSFYIKSSFLKIGFIETNTFCPFEMLDRTISENNCGFIIYTQNLKIIENKIFNNDDSSLFLIQNKFFPSIIFLNMDKSRFYIACKLANIVNLNKVSNSRLIKCLPRVRWRVRPCFFSICFSCSSNTRPSPCWRREPTGRTGRWSSRSRWWASPAKDGKTKTLLFFEPASLKVVFFGPL